MCSTYHTSTAIFLRADGVAVLVLHPAGDIRVHFEAARLFREKQLYVLKPQSSVSLYSQGSQLLHGSGSLELSKAHTATN